VEGITSIRQARRLHDRHEFFLVSPDARRTVRTRQYADADNTEDEMVKVSGVSGHFAQNGGEGVSTFFSCCSMSVSSADSMEMAKPSFG
jgi:hypothetical protein